MADKHKRRVSVHAWGKGQLCCIETGVLTRKRSSVRDVLLGGVLHSEGNASTPGGGTPIGGLKGEKRNVDKICSVGMFVGGGGEPWDRE